MCRPKELGGLGIHNLEILSWALRMKCLWIQKTEPDRSWAVFDTSVPSYAAAMFSISVKTDSVMGKILILD